LSVKCSPPPERLSTSIRVRLTPSEKRELERLADHAGVSMAEAMRAGAWLYLLRQECS
jgi:hypothetical protein